MTRLKRCILLTYGPSATLSPAAKVAHDAELRRLKLERRERARELRKISDPFACSVCGARISAPASLARGIGPVCNHRKGKQ